MLCAGAPDTPEIAAEVTGAVQELSRARTGVFWVREMLPIGKIREILSAATVFVCPSVYEPLGIVNLEAMACATAVVASDVGGIPEVVADGIRPGCWCTTTPATREFFESRLADAVNALVADPERARQYGEAGRQRCIDEFSWAHIAEQTLEIYRKVSARRPSVARLAGDALEFVAEGGRLFGGEFDDEPATAFQWYPHHDAAPLLGCFQRTVAGPGLHRRHRVLPPHEPAAHPSTAPGTELLLNFTPLFPIGGVRCAKTRSRSPRHADQAAAGTQQDATWSSTIPVACIRA